MDIKTTIKSMGFLFWIPILINDVLIPSVVYIIKMSANHMCVLQGIYTLTQMFVPFLSIFWIVIHLSKYVDENGNEIFFIKNRIKLLEIIKLYILYIVINNIFFIWYYTISKELLLELIHLIIVSLLFVSAIYLLVFLFDNISLAIIPMFLYAISSITNLNSTLSKISFYEYMGMSMKQLKTKYIHFLIIGIIFMIIATILNKNKEKYK